MPAIFAKGTQLKVGDGATPTEVFTTIAGIRTITGPDMSAEVLDITSHDTPGGFRDHMQGLKDWGMLSFELLWDPANIQHKGLFNDFVSGAVKHYQVIYPDTAATKFSFSGFVGNNPTSAPFDGPLTKTVEIHIMGSPAPTFTPALLMREGEAEAAPEASEPNPGVPPWATAGRRPEAEARA